MNKIKFSVLMSVYKNDTPENVKVAIDSILNQTLQPNQFVIMVDGKIPSKLEKMLDEVCEKNNIIELHKRDKNLGLGLTLNEGIKYCKYDYIARMDSDDYSYPYRFEEEIEYLSKHPEVDIVGSSIEEYDETLNTKLAERVVPESDADIKQYMKKRNGMNHVTAIYKKQSVIEVGSYENYMYFEDYFLWCKMIKNNCQFYNIQKPLMKIRAGDDMAKRRGGLYYSKCIIKFENKIKEMGIINSYIYIYNLIIRLLVANVPNNLRSMLYKKKLRGK